ncbi:MAG: 50S ribosomal protein L10 [Candidatus Hermodarchaeota archaeon]|nr:50S ribosomal protein L10 [Candidatus Hermodarchaeota archaeon]
MSSGQQPQTEKDVPRTTRGRPVPQTKLAEVGHLISLLEKYDYISLLRTEQIGSKQLQAIKKALRNKAIISMARNSLMIRALQNASQKKKNLDKLIPFVEGSSAFAFTDISPFELSDLLLQNKAKAPAKAGTVTPDDIIIEAGNTGFPPGPLISELGQVGLKTRIQGGSIWITQDHVIVKAGETVTRAQALVMSRLGMEPYEIFLKLTVAYDNGILLSPDVFEIRRSDVVDQLALAGQEGFALAIAMSYITAEITPLLLQEAATAARSLSLFAGILTDETSDQILAQADQGATALAQAVRSKDPKAMPN